MAIDDFEVVFDGFDLPDDVTDLKDDENSLEGDPIDLSDLDDPFTTESEEEDGDEDIDLPDDGDIEIPFGKTNTSKPSEKDIIQGSSLLLQDLGLFSLEKDEKIETLEDLQNVLSEKAAGAILQGLVDETPDIGKNLVAYVLNKGQDLTVEDLKAFYTQNLQEVDLTNLSFSNENIQDAREYMESKLTEKGLPTSVIKSALDTLEIENKLLEEANAYLEKDKQEMSTSKKVEESAEQRKKRLDGEKAFANNIVTKIQSSKWKPEKQQQVAGLIRNGEVLEFAKTALNDPELLVTFAELLTYYNKEKKEFNLEALAKKEATREVENQKKSLFQDYLSSLGSNKSADIETPLSGNGKKATFKKL